MGTIDGNVYLVPSVARVTQINSASTSSVSHNYKDLNTFKEDRAAALNIKGAYGLKSGSAAIKGGDSVKTSLQNDKQFTEFTNLYKKYSLRMQTSFQPTAPVKEAVKIDESSGDQTIDAAATRFLATYGTHMITEVTMGGRLSIQTTADACISSAEAERQAEVEACAAYNAAVSSVEACASGSISQGESSESSSKGSTCNLKVEGGDFSKCQAGKCGSGMCDNNAWANTVGQEYQRLSPLSFQLQALPDLIRQFNTDGAAHMTKWADKLEEKIKAKWEAAAQAATNVQVDESKCENSATGQLNAGEGIHCSTVAGIMVLLGFAVSN